MRSLTALLPCTALLLALAGETRAAERDEYQQHHDRALALYKAEQYEEAVREFDAAYALRQYPALLFNLGQAHRKLGNGKKALGYYEFYLRVEPHPRADVRAELDRYIAQARAMIEGAEGAKRRAQQAEADAASEGDGRPRLAPPVTPPPRAARQGTLPDAALRVSLPPVAGHQPLHRRWWLWTAVGGVAAGAALTAVFVAQPWRPRVPDSVIDLREATTLK